MKKHSSHVHRASAGAPASPAAVTTQAWVRLLFTGICRLVCSNPHTPMVVLMPDGREPRQSSTDPSLTIPSHHAYVMFPKTAIDTTEPGRDPDYYVGAGNYAVCLLEDEMISLAGGTVVPLPTAGPAGIIDMRNVCVHAQPDPSFTAFPPAPGVLAQVQVPSNQFAAHVLSAHTVVFEPACSGVAVPMSGQVAEVVRVDLEINDASSLLLVSHPFGGTPAAAPVRLSLAGTTAEAPLEVTFANTPLPDLLRWMGELAPAPHGDRDIHFELYYTLALHPPQAVPIPIMQSMIIGVSNCPPTCC